MKKIFKFLKDEEGISSVEYALLLAFIAAGIAGAAKLLGDAVKNRIDEATTEVGSY